MSSQCCGASFLVFVDVESEPFADHFRFLAESTTAATAIAVPLGLGWLIQVVTIELGRSVVGLIYREEIQIDFYQRILTVRIL